MKPLNKAERSKAFWPFLGLFVLTTGLVATAIFFSTQVSAADNRQLRQRALDAERRTADMENFAAKVRETLAELAKYETGGGLPSAIHQNVNYRLTELKALLQQMPNSQQSIYDLSVQALDDLNKARKKIVDGKPQ